LLAATFPNPPFNAMTDNVSQRSSTVHDPEAITANLGEPPEFDNKTDPYLIDSFEEGDPANPKVRPPS
jgi:hypothetical protein